MADEALAVAGDDKISPCLFPACASKNAFCLTTASPGWPIDVPSGTFVQVPVPELP
jgi:hypothetical protein